MALSLRQIATYTTNQNARERVRAAAMRVGRTIRAQAEPAADATAAQKEHYKKRRRLAQAFIQTGAGWADALLARALDVPEVAGMALCLIADSNMLTAEQEQDLDDALVTALTDCFDEFVDMPN